MILSLAACSVGPAYQEPGIALAPSFAEGAPVAAGEAATQQWWRAFNDPLLNELIDAGLSQNLSIQMALSRVSEAQAAARGAGLPALLGGGLSASAGWSEAEGSISSTRSASLSPSLILDLFGGEQRARERAVAQLQSAELGVGEARLAFTASLVSTYIDLRYYQEALAYTRQSLASRRETLRIVQVMFDEGVATGLSGVQAQAALHDATASLPGLESGFYASVYAIATLLAVPVQELQARLERGAGQPLPRGADAGAGVPADLLRNRPDLRAAERDYAAAVAGQGVSQAALYPSISLGGTISATGSSSWSFGPSLSLPVLNRPGLTASRDQAVARAEQAELTWRRAVLTAVEEVQVAQTGYLRQRRAVSASTQAVASYEQFSSMSAESFELGSTTILEVLESQRGLVSSRMSLAAGRRDLAARWAALQVAAGRGWATTPGS